jgi:uncharacterized membrane protein
MKNNLKILCNCSVLVALYVVLTVLLEPLSFGAIQFRIGELLILFCFYNKKYAIPLVVACLIANLFSPMPLDVLFGTLGTLLAVILIMFTKNVWLSAIWPCITNGIFVTIEIMIMSNIGFSIGAFFGIAWTIALSELVIVLGIGVPLFKLLRRNPKISKLLLIDNILNDSQEDQNKTI